MSVIEYDVLPLMLYIVLHMKYKSSFFAVAGCFNKTFQCFVLLKSQVLFVILTVRFYRLKGNNLTKSRARNC